MPLYTFVCRAGHASDALAPVGVTERTCVCGESAHKQSVYAIAQSTPEPRYAGKDYIEAAAQVESKFADFEQREGIEVERPSFWNEAKQRVARMQKE